MSSTKVTLKDIEELAHKSLVHWGMSGTLSLIKQRENTVFKLETTDSKYALFGVELVQDRETKTAATEAAGKVVNRMKEEGILISRIGVDENILKIRPPLCFQKEHADQLVNTLDAVLAEN